MSGGVCVAKSGALVGPTCEAVYELKPFARAIAERQREDSEAWLRGRLAGMPMHWRRFVAEEHGRRGGLEAQAANLWLLQMTAEAVGKLELRATDGDIREAAREAERMARWLAREELRDGNGHEGVRRVLVEHCRNYGIEPAEQEGEPGLLRMLDGRWYLRRLRRAHARRAEGAAIRGGMVKRSLWPYASADAVQRRQDQRQRNAAAMESAVAVSADGEAVHMAAIVAGSLANPECRRSELMVRIRGCDEYAEFNGWACEFWTMTTPSRFHAQKAGNLFGGANPKYEGATPRDAQAWLSSMWAKARAAWARRGLVVAGLRTAEPHHDGTPHWHLIVYGPAEDIRLARHLLRRAMMRDNGGENGARKHRFNFKISESGKGAAAYAAAYVSKNINGAGMEGEADTEAGGYISEGVKRVDAWASHWSIRQFQFFGMPRVGIWRTLRRIEASSLPADSHIERARRAADDSDWCGFWRAAVAGGLELIKAGIGRLTEYGDAAAEKIAGVKEGGRRLLLAARDWVIHWGAARKKGDEVVFDLPRSCVNNCTVQAQQERAAAAVARDFADMAAAIFDDAEAMAA